MVPSSSISFTTLVNKNDISSFVFHFPSHSLYLSIYLSIYLSLSLYLSHVFSPFMFYLCNVQTFVVKNLGFCYPYASTSYVVIIMCFHIPMFWNYVFRSDHKLFEVSPHHLSFASLTKQQPIHNIYSLSL
jgi:hypothetical protein